MQSHVMPYFWLAWQPRFGLSYLRHRMSVRRHERMSMAEMREYQWSLLKSVLTRAYAEIPFYRKRLNDVGIAPDDIQDPSDFERVPLLSKADLAVYSSGFAAEATRLKGCMRDQTGGSTGDPASFYVSVKYKGFQRAITQRSRSWAEYQEGDKLAVVWGAARDLPQQTPFARFRKQWILRERWLNAFSMRAESMERFAHELLDWKPDAILAYSNALYLFAQFIRERGLDRIRPKAIETSAETLWEHQRDTIEDVFKCKIHNAYASREVNNVAYECEEHRGLHVLSDNVYVEIMNGDQPARPGEVGDVVVTTLRNDVMPLIRYRIGDMARATDDVCPCGRPFPLIAEVLGRANDVVVNPAGDVIHGAFFTRLFYGMTDRVKQIQVQQRSVDSLRVMVVPHDAIPEDILQSLKARIEANMGDGVDVQVEVVNEIVPGPSGKHRYVISEVPSPFAAARRSR